MATALPARDYSLTGPSAAQAIERGLAEATWYQSPVPRCEMRRLLERRDGPAIRDTLLWFALLAATAAATVHLWPSWWAAVPYLVYAVLYATASDSRWHEASHGTAFKTGWMNDALYEIASFMVMRESVVWRWSHNRHHSDTIIVGRDPEIQIPRPPRLGALTLGLANLGNYRTYFTSLLRHAAGHLTDAERTFIPASESPLVVRNARIVLALNLAVVATAIALGSWLPILFILVPQVFGTWLMMVHNTTQHAGLAEDVLDHRLNCRTVYMNPISRFIYWNMNYHVEHHMFPLVPYHALPRLHTLVQADCPPPYPSILSAWREILPAILRQVREPGYHVQRPLPPPTASAPAAPRPITPVAGSAWLDIGAAADLERGDVLRVDHGGTTFACIRDAQGRLFATDGICTHGNTHLAEGLVHGGTIECPKHNGRFRLDDGAPARAPICRGLATYPIEEVGGRLRLDPTRPGGSGARTTQTWRLRVASTRMVATFIREVVLEPVADRPTWTPGDYLQLDIPAYGEVRFADLDVPEPYAATWREQGLFDLVARNPGQPRRNNYSIASNPASERGLRLNVRLALPPAGQTVAPGIGSTYVFHLKPGDEVSAIGPFGDFHPKPTQREMVYIGGGAGMAPIRAHLAWLLETQHSQRRISYWYGARSRQELFYHDLFTDLAAQRPNFTFHPALSAPLPGDAWQGATGFIHEVVLAQHLRSHPRPAEVEYYLCGPPPMIAACTRMLADLGVPADRIAFDAF